MHLNFKSILSTKPPNTHEIDQVPLSQDVDYPALCIFSTVSGRKSSMLLIHGLSSLILNAILMGFEWDTVG